MHTLLLLAGRSTRFWPLEEKTLFPICGKTLLEYQVERLRAGGCESITLVGGAHNLKTASLLFPSLPTIEQENLDLGMRGALLSALPQCGDEPVMIVSNNDVIDPGGYAALLESSDDGAILAQRVDRYFPGGYLTLDGTRVQDIVEKPGEGNEPSDLVNIVAHLHRKPRALFDALQDVDESRDDGYEQALAILFKEHVYEVVAYEGHWQAVKYPWHLLSLLTFFLDKVSGKQIDPSTEVHPTATIEGSVTLGKDVKVFPNACIVGPCTIGNGTVIANNALVRSASIGRNCVVGYNTEICRSILGDGVWTHMNYVGDSVIGDNVSLGGGTITGNLRLDEKDVASIVKGEVLDTSLPKFGTVIGAGSRIGIHVSINPGRKIGGGSFVSSKTLVSEDIPDRSFVCMKGGSLDVRENRVVVPQTREIHL